MMPLITLSGCIIAPETMSEEANSAIRSDEAEIDGNITLEDICPKLYEDKVTNIRACAESLKGIDLSEIEAIEFARNNARCEVVMAMPKRQASLAIFATGLYGILMMINGMLESGVWYTLTMIGAGICLTVVMLYIWRSTLPPSSPQ